MRGAGEQGRTGGRQSLGPGHPSLELSVPASMGARGQWSPQHSSLGPGRQCLKSMDFQNPNVGLWMDQMHESACVRVCARMQGNDAT